MDRRVEHAPRTVRTEHEGQLLLRVRGVDRRPYPVVPDPFVEIVEPPGGERGRSWRAPRDRNRWAPRPSRREASRSSGGRDRRRAAAPARTRGRRAPQRRLRPLNGTGSLRERQDQNRGRDKKRIERIGLVGHEGVTGAHAEDKRRNGKRNGEQRGAQAARVALRGDNRRGRATRHAVIGPRRQDRPLESGEEDRRQRKGREHVDCQLQRQRRCREHRLQRHDDDEVEEIDRVGDAAEEEACASDDPIAEQALGPPEHADRDHAERRRDVRKRELSRRVAADGQDRDAKLDGNRNAKQREQYAQTPLA